MDKPSLIDSATRAALLTSAAALLVERESLVARIADIDGHLTAIERLTGQKLVPDGAVPQREPTEHEAPPPTTWIDFIVSRLAAVNGGLTGKQLIAAIKESPDFATRFARSPNSYYNALRRLEGLGRTVKVGHVTYLKDTREKIDKGVMIDETAPDERSGAMSDYITEVLRESPHSMTASEVLTALNKIPEARAKIEANRQIAYATLSRLFNMAIIKRDDAGRYRVRDDQEPPPSRTLQLLRGGAGDVS